MMRSDQHKKNAMAAQREIHKNNSRHKTLNALLYNRSLDRPEPNVVEGSPTAFGKTHWTKTNKAMQNLAWLYEMGYLSEFTHKYGYFRCKIDHTLLMVGVHLEETSYISTDKFERLKTSMEQGLEIAKQQTNVDSNEYKEFQKWKQKTILGAGKNASAESIQSSDDVLTSPPSSASGGGTENPIAQPLAHDGRSKSCQERKSQDQTETILKEDSTKQSSQSTSQQKGRLRLRPNSTTE